MVSYLNKHCLSYSREIEITVKGKQANAKTVFLRSEIVLKSKKKDFSCDLDISAFHIRI